MRPHAPSSARKTSAQEVVQAGLDGRTLIPRVPGNRQLCLAPGGGAQRTGCGPPRRPASSWTPRAAVERSSRGMTPWEGLFGHPLHLRPSRHPHGPQGAWHDGVADVLPGQSGQQAPDLPEGAG